MPWKWAKTKKVEDERLPERSMMPEFIFNREEERQGIRQRLAKKRPFLIHGPAGVGKTLLLRSLLPEFTSVLYCEDSATTHVVLRSLAPACCACAARAHRPLFGTRKPSRRNRRSR
jgi:DNA polymerase III delta prime subunit